MTKERFEAILAAYGADARRWPEAERAAAEAYLAANPTDLTDARVIDALLDAAPQPAPPSDVLMRRILREAPKRPMPRYAPALALAACMVIAVLIGYGAGALAPPSASGADELVAAALDPLSPGGDSL